MGMATARNSGIEVEDGECQPKSMQPERNLCAAILGAALLDLQDNRTADKRQQAYYFLVGKGVFGEKRYEKYPFTVQNICLHLDLAVEEVRRIAEEIFHTPRPIDW